VAGQPTSDCATSTSISRAVLGGFESREGSVARAACFSSCSRIKSRWNPWSNRAFRVDPNYWELVPLGRLARENFKSKVHGVRKNFAREVKTECLLSGKINPDLQLIC